MNREQRRQWQRDHRGMPGKKFGDGPIKINYGHDGTLVVLQFTSTTREIRLSVEQTDDMIAALQQSKKMLADHQKKPANG
ncbi:MAG: hypothetical protein NUV34_00950 [Sulfuricaulis sp.]|nr:hypothetical protein [Sulfuricaulis sp.]